MNYLFFDIECASCNGTGGKICSYGYVLTDGNFNILAQEDILINPKAPFDPYVVRSILNYPVSTFAKQPDFSEIYPRIQSLMKAPDTLAAGFAVQNDIGFLASECRRYHLPSLAVPTLDLQRVIRAFLCVRNAPNLASACEALSITVGKDIHRSDADAYYTMILARELCRKYDVKMEDFSAMLPELEARAAMVRESDGIDEKAREESRQNRYLSVYAESVKPRSENCRPMLSGVRVALERKREIQDTELVLSLIQAIVDAGGEYTQKASSCSLFVTDEAQPGKQNSHGRRKGSSRLESVRTAIAHGADITVISFQDLYDFLGMTEKAIRALPHPPFVVPAEDTSPQEKEEEAAAQIPQAAPKAMPKAVPSPVPVPTAIPKVKKQAFPTAILFP